VPATDADRSDGAGVDGLPGGVIPPSTPAPARAPVTPPGSTVAMLGVGAIVKPHGLRGEVIVTLSTNRPERVDPGTVLTAGDGREFRVLRSSFHRGRFIVSFEGVDGIDQAESLRGTALFAPPLDDPDELWVHELIGARVEDASGAVLGTVDGVQANPASDLLVLDGGALIPLRFVVDSEPGVRVTVEVPDGLLDLG
jgi:16S rRNA processing protein RimM